MASVLRPIGHEDRLSIVDHLDELRTRLFVCMAVLTVAFGFCYWQNHALLKLLNQPLPASPKTSANHLSGLTSSSVKAAHQLELAAGGVRALATSHTQSASDRALFSAVATHLGLAAKALPQATPKRLPITTGVGEPFTTTLTVAAYFALIVSLPVLLYQVYAFILPALKPEERRVALPLMMMAPVLFIIGVVFAFLGVLPPAVKFLQSYNSQNFDILVQAKPLYTFEIFTMLGVGLAFQMPIGLLALQRVGVVSARTLTHHWRYAVVIIAVIAAALPGVDPVTTAFEMIPLVLLYLLSIVMLKFADRRTLAHAAKELQQLDDDDSHPH